MSELADHLGLDAFDLVGYSMGGVAATITATQAPRVRRLVIGGIGSAIVELGGVDTRVMDRDALADVLERDDDAPVDDPTIAAFRGFVDAVGGARLAPAAQARSVHRTPIALDRITAPTLLLVGADDHLASRPEVLAAALADCRVVVVPGDHMGALADPGFTPALVAHLSHPATEAGRHDR